VSLYQNSNDDLSAMISAAAGVTVATADYTILGIRATTTAEQTQYGKNTKIAIQMNASSTLRGQMSLYYDRLNLASLANFTPYLLSSDVNVDISQLLTTIRDMYGILFTMADLADAQTQDDGTGTGGTTLVLTALAGSYGYTGTVTIHFAPLPNIGTAFYSPQLSGF
jgi:uncharacterized protein (UPF0264 family)